MVRSHSKTPTCEARQIPAPSSSITPALVYSKEVAHLFNSVHRTQWAWQRFIAFFSSCFFVNFRTLAPVSSFSFVLFFLLLVDRYKDRPIQNTTLRWEWYSEIHDWSQSLVMAYTCYRRLTRVGEHHQHVSHRNHRRRSNVSRQPGSSFPCVESWANCAGEKAS